MQFGIASTSQGFGFDGILGIGPRDLTCALKNLPESMLPTVTDCLFQQRNILYVHGEISFGEANPYSHTGNIEYTDITTPTSSRYWSINQRITYGYTFLYIASDAYERYEAATGGTVNAANGFPLTTTLPYGLYKLTPNAQIWPRSLNDKPAQCDLSDPQAGITLLFWVEALGLLNAIRGAATMLRLITQWLKASACLPGGDRPGLTNVKKTHLLLLIKAIALFNANQHEEAIMRVTQSIRDIPENDPVSGIDHDGLVVQKYLFGWRKLGQQSLFLGVVHPRLSFGEGLVVPDDVDAVASADDQV
ncbi:hypothetical protein BDR07DRAFT_1501905 [Suillus spraguei]|nr:hypothetical protein BDR07DRAFT_1501905 [Suillus spraguei]